MSADKLVNAFINAITLIGLIVVAIISIHIFFGLIKITLVSILDKIIHKVPFFPKKLQNTWIDRTWNHFTSTMNMNTEEMAALTEFIGKIPQAQSREAFKISSENREDTSQLPNGK